MTHIIIAILFFTLLSSISLVNSEVRIDADGNAHVVIKGDSHRVRYQKDESDYYLHVRPMDGRVDSFCTQTTAALSMEDPEYLDNILLYGNTLIEDIKASKIADPNNKLLFEKRVLQCQTLLLLEKRRILQGYYEYAISKARESYQRSAEISRALESMEAFLRRLNRR